jgi:hypothetical protein
MVIEIDADFILQEAFSYKTWYSINVRHECEQCTTLCTLPVAASSEALN